ncbi:MAG TPA: uroporphyrinogen decarboxylase family protein [bacterium]|nr:uroporphyrinogen decarboxylase family protein [bacterium]HPN93982.1 uroporphyrinogen decarboxylase family protein [bacterium]
MKSRERVLAAINHQPTDRVPLDLGGNVSTFTAEAYRKMLDFLNFKDSAIAATDFFTVIDIDERVLERFHIDIRRVWLNPPDDYRQEPDSHGMWHDEWGIKRTVSAGYSEIVENPLRNASVSDLDRFPFPNPDDPGRFRGLKERVEYLYNETEYAISAVYPFGGILELACWLRGMDAFMMDMAARSDFAFALLDKITGVMLRLYSQFLDIAGPYAQIFETADDYGMQTGPLISPAMYGNILAPYQRMIIEIIHAKSDAKIFHHSCGSIIPLVPELISTGVDILNPIQPLAKNMEPENLKEKFGEQIVFHGGICVQELLPNGSPEEVRAETLRRIEILGRGGGYILAPAHNIQSDVPPLNVASMFDAALETKC